MNREKIKQKIKFCIVMLIIVISIAISLFIVLRYQVEGEKKVPYEVGQIIAISSATITDYNFEKSNVNTEVLEQTDVQNQETKTKNENENNNTTTEQETVTEENYIWKEKVIQTNDLCITLNQNANYKKNKTIKNVRIENIKILKNPKIGNIRIFMPNSLDDGLYKYTSDFLVNSNLKYSGASEDNKKALQIRNKGGSIYISFANLGLDEYKSNDDQEISQDATILQKMNLSDEDLKFKISFDLIIEVEDMTYSSNISLDLPVDNLIGQKETHTTITDFDNLIYKRIK